MSTFRAGQLKDYIPAWTAITSDKEVLETISGLPIPVDELPKNMGSLYPANKRDNLKIGKEIEKLEEKGVVVQCEHEQGEYISPIFLTPKSDGGSRMILNLKRLNSSIEKKKFKMQTLSSILSMIRPNMYMAKLDIKDAYYSIPIRKIDQKYLKFEHKGKLYKYTVLPNGYTEGPRKFTKAMKPPLSELRKDKVTLADYIDDLITMNSKFHVCLDNVHKIVNTLDELGFIIHPKKSIFVPSKIMEFLGHVIDTISMTVTITKIKKERLIDLCQEILDADTITIREVSKLLGKFSSSLLGVPYGRLHYRSVERFKTYSLKQNRGKFDALVKLPLNARLDIKWWRDNITNSFAPIFRGNPSVMMTSDASSFGWGASKDGLSTGGCFTQLEMLDHINTLELKAALFALQSLCRDDKNCHILLKIDNTSAVACINKMGSVRSIEMDKVSQLIWSWACGRNNWVTATHIPGVLNIEADRESRECAERTEWQLNPKCFDQIIKDFETTPKIDLFASRLNKQVKKFCSYRPDPECILVNAFTVNWEGLIFYAFPPFNCISKVFQKIYFDQAHGILVVPDWPNQPWYNQVMEAALKVVRLEPSADLLLLPAKPKRHPLWRTIALIAVLL